MQVLARRAGQERGAAAGEPAEHQHRRPPAPRAPRPCRRPPRISAADRGVPAPQPETVFKVNGVKTVNYNLKEPLQDELRRQEEAQLNVVFHRMDINGDGRVCKEDLVATLARLHQKCVSRPQSAFLPVLAPPPPCVKTSAACPILFATPKAQGDGARGNGRAAG